MNGWMLPAPSNRPLTYHRKNCCAEFRRATSRPALPGATQESGSKVWKTVKNVKKSVRNFKF
jgi:hypothetical protein